MTDTKELRAKVAALPTAEVMGRTYGKATNQDPDPKDVLFVLDALTDIYKILDALPGLLDEVDRLEEIKVSAESVLREVAVEQMRTRAEKAEADLATLRERVARVERTWARRPIITDPAYSKLYQGMFNGEMTRALRGDTTQCARCKGSRALWDDGWIPCPECGDAILSDDQPATEPIHCVSCGGSGRESAYADCPACLGTGRTRPATEDTERCDGCGGDPNDWEHQDPMWGCPGMCPECGKAWENVRPGKTQPTCSCLDQPIQVQESDDE